MFVIAGESLLIPYAALRGYPDGAAGVILAFVPAGMFAGNLAVTRGLTQRGRERAVAPLVVVFGLPLLPFAFGVDPVVAAVLMAVLGCGAAFALGLQQPFNDALPDDSRGQAFGLMSTGLMTCQGIGPLLFGGLTEFMAVGVVMALAGAATLGTAAWIAVAVRSGADAETPVPS
jgi:predicted MFS family arabinose efflux permease